MIFLSQKTQKRLPKGHGVPAKGDHTLSNCVKSAMSGGKKRSSYAFVMIGRFHIKSIAANSCVGIARRRHHQLRKKASVLATNDSCYALEVGDSPRSPLRR
jgi:hypothetical protein